MDEAALHELMSGKRRDLDAILIRSVLSIAAVGYASAMWWRNLAYDGGWLRTHHVSVPVISLGNITTGGTGKTPFAAWLANWLLSNHCRPGLLSRGYRSLGPENRSSGVVSGNDEKLVLDRLCPTIPHIQQRDRVGSARQLIDEFDCNVLILDDGFQHRRLRRDLDLVLIDAMQPWGFNHVLPRGLLREQKSALRRADLVLITRANLCGADELKKLRSELFTIRSNEECVELAFAPQRLINLDGQIDDLKQIRAKRCLAFCGIGNPMSFRKTAESFGDVVQFQSFPDHYHYKTDDLDSLAAEAKQLRADIVLTTLKDLVKVHPDDWHGPPLAAVDIGLEFLCGREILESRLQKIIGLAVPPSKTD